ncbi:uncharacterized protein LOC105181554 [Harpegnathos saltator]|uniref:Large ribosomal subunit protein mL50 n=1 Tax=Harpegnathos saltator TaxID=610380 RepID=E2BDC1_HARSA|nr:uncharacterized protein LOC105181554 [Harpegnathos saltator]EFN86349.1 39S ribosomal protein L50, mitochondrial [Harpegnathos saltator]
MAALIRHGLFANAFKSTPIIVRNKVSVNKAKEFPRDRRLMEIKARLNSVTKSLGARGFLRPQRAYEPTKDTSERINKICASQAISSGDDVKLEDPHLRFKLLVACEEEFQHCVPSSLLHTIENIGDLKQFYRTPVDSATPYEALANMQLPENLHVQQEYHRFHPDTDTLFNGKTAFPKSSTIVTGLKYKKKYPGHYQGNPFLDEQLKI